MPFQNFSLTAHQDRPWFKIRCRVFWARTIWGSKIGWKLTNKSEPAPQLRSSNQFESLSVSLVYEWMNYFLLVKLINSGYLKIRKINWFSEIAEFQRATKNGEIIWFSENCSCEKLTTKQSRCIYVCNRRTTSSAIAFVDTMDLFVI